MAARTTKSGGVVAMVVVEVEMLNSMSKVLTTLTAKEAKAKVEKAKVAKAKVAKARAAVAADAEADAEDAVEEKV